MPCRIEKAAHLSGEPQVHKEILCLSFEFGILSLYLFGSEDILALAVELVLDGQYEQAGDEHCRTHDVVAGSEGTRVDLDPGHHVRSDPAAEIAAGIDESDGTSSRRTREERRRDRPPDAHGGVDADSGEADECECDRQALSERGEAEADSTDEERAGYMPDLIARLRSCLADDELHDESRRHRDGDCTAEQGRGEAGEFLENGRHPEVEAPETNDPEEIDEAELEDFRIMEGLENRVFFAGLHGSLFFLEVVRQIFLFSIREPANLVRTIFDAEEEENGEGESRDGFEDKEFLPAMHAEEGAFEQYAGKRCTDDVREQQRRQHEACGASSFTCREPAREEHRVDDGVEAGFRGAKQETAEEELELRRHEGHEDADKAPGEHDARNPLRGGEMGGYERARNLENQIADEEDAGAHAEDFRRDPRQIGRHRELGIREIDAVNAGDDRDEEDRQDDTPVTCPF